MAGLQRSTGILSKLNLSPFGVSRTSGRRCYNVDGRNRLSNHWIPTGKLDESRASLGPGLSLLVSAGYLRRAHSGIFHFLPLGLRVLGKLEALIDKHMLSLGASKLSLSSITSERLWQRSGRLEKNPELLRINDRNKSKFLLSPTHEEEITELVASCCNSPKDLPIRLYQISRKYRDEIRPRQGLLRTKEFMMKDLYTFDVDDTAAMRTYEDVVKAYRALFNDLQLDFHVANADSGDMGGNLSHEFHLLAPDGEDDLFICNNESCQYTANQEVVEKFGALDDAANYQDCEVVPSTCISEDKTRLVQIFVPDIGRNGRTTPRTIHSLIDFREVKKIFPNLDTSLDPETDAFALWSKGAERSSVDYIYDYRVASDRTSALRHQVEVPTEHLNRDKATGRPLKLTNVQHGDHCPKCESGKLSKHRAIEIGHTFHLGTRYSKPLEATFHVKKGAEKQPFQMGCHGIGVTRLIGALATHLSNPNGLVWPSCIAPFDLVIVAKGSHIDDATRFYDHMKQVYPEFDVVIDDRLNKPLGWKLRDADLIGARCKIIFGGSWGKRRVPEIVWRSENVDANYKDISRLNEVVQQFSHQT